MPPAENDMRSLFARIVAAYDGLTNAEIAYGTTKPSVVEAAREALRARIEEARQMTGGKPRR